MASNKDKIDEQATKGMIKLESNIKVKREFLSAVKIGIVRYEQDM